MSWLAPHSVRIVASALVAAVLFAAAPARLAANPEPPAENAAVVAQKRAEREAALAELELMRADMSSRVSEYISLGRRMERAQSEIVEVEAELLEVNADLIAKERAVTNRAVELYRSDRMGLLESLLDARSLQEFMVRARYLVIISERDHRMLAELRLTRTESMWLQESLFARIEVLKGLQAQADESRERIEADMEIQEARAASLGEDIAVLMRPRPQPAAAAAVAGAQPTGEFDAFTVVSDYVFRDSMSMTAEDIQAFLNRQPGTLKNYRAADHAGQVKSAAEMVAEAAQAWDVNPKVILAKLQKEQSLLARPNPTQQAYDWAMGCGKTDSRTIYKYQGFGKQVWFGAATLDKNAKRWKPGVTLTITGNQVTPTNASTYSLYKYTPHIAGTMSFWMLYWRYFGDPLAGRPVVTPSP